LVRAHSRAGQIVRQAVGTGWQEVPTAWRKQHVTPEDLIDINVSARQRFLICIDMTVRVVVLRRKPPHVS
jgi:hypothetical protein